ncbi:MAG: TPM domain-containing protein [Paracoccaceae bacterium]
MKVAAVLALLAFLAAGAPACPALAEALPVRADPHVNDYAGMIDDAAEARIAARLTSLADETGVEATVLTVPSRDGHAPTASLEAFARSVFDGWGLGRKDRNDGLLLVVVAAERVARIELGAGYDQGYDVTSQDIVTRRLVPALREGKGSEGIEAAAGEMADRIGRRLAERTGATGQASARGMGGRDWLLLALFGGAAAAIALRARGRRGHGPGGPEDGGRSWRRGERPEQASREADRAAPDKPEGGRSGGGGASGRW